MSSPGHLCTAPINRGNICAPELCRPWWEAPGWAVVALRVPLDDRDASGYRLNPRHNVFCRPEPRGATLTAAPAALPFGLESDSRPELSTAAQRFASVLVLMSSACCAPIAITRIRTSERARGSGNCAGAGIFQKPTLEPRSKAIRVPHLFVGALIGPKAKPLSC